MSTATSLVRAVLSCAAARGVEPRALLAPSGIDARIVEDRDARVATTAYLEIFAAAVRRTDDPAFGVEVAGAFDAACFGLLGFVVASCATLGEALARFCRHARLLCDELVVEIVPRGDEVSIVYALDASPAVPALYEMAFTHLVRTARRGTRGAFQPRRVILRHPTASPPLRDALGAEIEIGAENAVICDRAALDLPLRGNNPALLGVLDAHLALIAGADASPDENEVTRTRAAIRGLLSDGHPSLSTVARRLGIGARTLQRRLRDRGLSFRELVDDVLRQEALRQLAAPEVSVAEVAFALGFSSPSAFHHAFRRWTGRSPGARA